MNSNPELEKLRHELDVVDNTILMALSKRKEIVDKIAELKAKEGIDAYQPDRFAQLLGKLQLKAAELDLDSVLVDEVWNAIHDSSLRQQGAGAPAD